MGKNDEGNKRYKFPVIKLISHSDVIHSTRNIVNSTIITLHGDRWLVDLETMRRCINVESLCYTPEANIILCVNYTSIKIIRKNPNV